MTSTVATMGEQADGSSVPLVSDVDEIRDLRPPELAARRRALAAALGLGLLLVAGAAAALQKAASVKGLAGARDGRAAVPMDKLEVKQDKCHTVAEGEESLCINDIRFVQEDLQEHPERYAGLDQDSPLEAIQAFLHFQHRCPEPCWGKNSSKKAQKMLAKAKRDQDERAKHAQAEEQEAIEKTREELQKKEAAGSMADECEVKEGTKCYKNVKWALHTGRFTHPEWYEGLPDDFAFEDVQARLHQDPENECPKPCKCHTAEAFDKCDESVNYVIEKGLHDHPEWYEGLTKASPRRDVQRKLFEQDKKSGCDRPCQEYELKPPTLFCFAVTMPSGDEAALVTAQVQKKVGIFACDDYALLCQEPANFGGVDAIHFQAAAVGTSKDGTAGNAELFMHVWKAVGDHGRFGRYDWTVKVDPDTVLLPERLRQHLAKPMYAKAQSANGAYVKQCSKWQGAGWPAMFGSLEAVSTPAVKAYLKDAERCRSELDWEAWGEDLYLSTCFDQVLGVPAIGDISLTGDDVCKGEGPSAGRSTGADCWDGKHASYHPKKNVGDWFECFDQANK